MPISIIEQSRTAESKTENKSERPGRRPLKGIQQIEGSLYWNHLPAKKSCRSDIRPLTNMMSSNSEYNKVSSVENTQQHCSQLVDEPRRKSLRDSNSLIHGGHTQYTKTTGCKTVEDSVLLERKFPGPAGILPKKVKNLSKIYCCWLAVSYCSVSMLTLQEYKVMRKNQDKHQKHRHFLFQLLLMMQISSHPHG
jgi:hypothetical protein